ncbi:hypothetical protein EUBHAL_01767 [Anaerobutyricum hallii DSM 3353]|uniref:Uncharacterized protein n=1 Tax=Anaerobutyricum hallii DSM 3353 TaxID=411469 RepID=C0EWH9_9FIRM|nr:hypothetical protein EUBHAL_01767 [Anaerobutyricum hallii DSM 3353]
MCAWKDIFKTRSAQEKFCTVNILQQMQRMHLRRNRHCAFLYHIHGTIQIYR